MNSEQIREMLEAATPGEWATDVSDFGMSNTGGAYIGVYEEYAGTLAHVLCRDMVGRGGDRPFEANAKLFAASKYLAAEVLRLRDEVSDALAAHKIELDRRMKAEAEVAHLRGALLALVDEYADPMLESEGPAYRTARAALRAKMEGE
jgi:hypothetical protein